MKITISRRDWLGGAVAFGGICLNPFKAVSILLSNEKLVTNQRGGYLFVPGIDFFSFGAVAADGFEIIRA